MPRLPHPGGDAGNWGQILNDYLSAAHNSDGSLKPDAVNPSTIQDNSIPESKLDPTVKSKLNSGGGTPGATGPVGATGATGPQGTQGASGLAGPQGATGATGATGPQGPAGASGTPGTQGASGTPGATGATGPQGATGPTGTTGSTGATGATGLAGSQGATGAVGATGAPGATTIAGISGLQGALDLRAVEVHYADGMWPARPVIPYTITWVSTTDVTAAAPPEGQLGDRWIKHPNAV